MTVGHEREGHFVDIVHKYTVSNQPNRRDLEIAHARQTRSRCRIRTRRRALVLSFSCCRRTRRPRAADQPLHPYRFRMTGSMIESFPDHWPRTNKERNWKKFAVVWLGAFSTVLTSGRLTIDHLELGSSQVRQFTKVPTNIRCRRFSVMGSCVRALR